MNLDALLNARGIDPEKVNPRSERDPCVIASVPSEGLAPRTDRGVHQLADPTATHIEDVDAHGFRHRHIEM